MIFQYDGGTVPHDLQSGLVSELWSRNERLVTPISFAPDAEEPEKPVVEEDLEAVERLRAEQASATAERDALHALQAAEAETAERHRKQIEDARAASLLEARREFDTELEKRLTEERRRFDRVRIEFARDRQRFFAAAESQVVLLGVAVARKILSREVVTDGLHLRATVKAALVRIQDGSTSTLRVAEEEVALWTEMFQRGSQGRVIVEGDLRLSSGECVLETTLGRVELGVDAQMEEIERGFGELMQQQGH
jgi:flagellar assembly protein FliH